MRFKIFLGLLKQFMTEEQKEKWRIVKEALEKAGKTDNHYYKRAAAVAKTGVDPGPEAFF